MQEELVFSIDNVTSDNILKISHSQSRTEESRLCEIAFAVDESVALTTAMLDEGYGIYEILSVISEGFSPTDPGVHTEALAESYSHLSSYLRHLFVYDRVFFSRLYIKKAMEQGVKIGETDFLSVYQGDESFTYVKNPLADEAYDVFSQDFPNATLRYSRNLPEAARAVRLGEFEYCLLPLEEKGGARLGAVMDILFREDLRINSVTPVFGPEGTADMKYALVSRHFTVPELRRDDDRYLEIRLRADSSVPLSELLLAADALGISIYRVNTISFDTEDGEAVHYSVVFKDEGADFSSLFVFLTLFAGVYTPIGIYKNLE